MWMDLLTLHYVTRWLSRRPDPAVPALGARVAAVEVDGSGMGGGRWRHGASLALLFFFVGIVSGDISPPLQ